MDRCESEEDPLWAKGRRVDDAATGEHSCQVREEALIFGCDIGHPSISLTYNLDVDMDI